MFKPPSFSRTALLLVASSTFVSCTSQEFNLPDPTWVDKASPLSLTFAEPVRPFFPTPSESSRSKPLPAEAGIPGRVSFTPDESGGGILSLEGAQLRPAEQSNDFWCWAACAQMANQFNGNSRLFPAFDDQAKIASYFSSLEDTEKSGARFATIARALAPELEAWFAAQPGSLKASVSVSTGDEIIAAMRAGEMPLISINNHVYAVLAVKFVTLPLGEAKQFAAKLKELKIYETWLPQWVPGDVSDLVTDLYRADDLVADYGIVKLDLWNPTEGEGEVSFTAEDLDALAEDGYKIDFVVSRLVAHDLFTGDAPRLDESLLPTDS